MLLLTPPATRSTADERKGPRVSASTTLLGNWFQTLIILCVTKSASYFLVNLRVYIFSDRC
ncbi:UNVERIFIED_CONTAM: hypothetical protein FKN15_019716 [Acipenser sinensis]